MEVKVDRRLATCRLYWVTLSSVLKDLDVDCRSILGIDWRFLDLERLSSLFGEAFRLKATALVA